MSCIDIINIVSNKASPIFIEKLDSQRIHESIKSANTAPVLSMQTNNLAYSQNFPQNGYAQTSSMELSWNKQKYKKNRFFVSRKDRRNLLE